MRAPEIFSPVASLPKGRFAIEASAGTGKTYTLAGLVVRYVAEQAVPIDKILIVTFTRAAAAELRDRVRSRLSDAVVALRAPPGSPQSDELFSLVAETDRERRLSRLEQSLIDFDAATITTIHGFAQQVLRTLGSAAAADLDAILLDDTGELLSSVCADVLAAESFVNSELTEPLPSLEELEAIAAKVLGNPGIRIVPDAAVSEVSPAAARLRRLVELTVEGVKRRRRAAGTVSFDDLLTQLRDALESEGAAKTLRRRFQVALIDEFQDTDPVQWAIFSKLFGLPGDESALVLVADPKQAIYAFRGANVHTYLQAAYEVGTERSTLGTNWRSDGALIAALERVFLGATFGDEKITFVPVRPSEPNEALRLSDDAGAPLPGLELRLVLDEDLARAAAGHITVDAAQGAIANDLAEKVHSLLDSAWLPARGDKARRRLCPSDIAVLVGQHAESEKLQAALRRRGIPAVTTRGDSVLQSPAATQWRWLLNALARPSDPTRARSAALTWFFGWTVERLDAADDEAVGEIQSQLDSWSKTLATSGTVALCAQVWSETDVAARVLASSDGDRNLTDLDHIASLVQASSIARRPTAVGLLALLDQLERAVTTDPENDVTSRQVESDAEAVQIMTVFVAKGLEFPVVCVPTMWRSGLATAREVVYQDPLTGIRSFDIANRADWPSAAEAAKRRALADAEALGESLRLLYVALTRAEHQTLLWWTPSYKSEVTGLARLLFARRNGEIDADMFRAERVLLPSETETASFLEAAFAKAGDAASVTVADGTQRTSGEWVNRTEETTAPALELAVLDKAPERSKRRWSFSAIAARAREGELDLPDETALDTSAFDEPLEEPDPVDPGSRPLSSSGSDLPLGDVPGGVQFGTLVHGVLEAVDFTAEDLDGELRTRVEDRMRWNPWPVDPERLVAGLRAVIETPLGPLFNGLRLRDLPHSERLDELSFEIRLGDRGGRPTERELALLVLGHVPEGDPLRSWAEQLVSALSAFELAGHLTGSIDMVARVHLPGQAPGHRFVVVDYKTNVLAEPGRLPQAYDYRPDRLPLAMAEHHYPLQALLYSVALHRYLRWRLPGYVPALHLGGIAYLFVRGMVGAATPVVEQSPYGVFNWRVPPSLVSRLSDLLDGAVVAP